MNIFKNNSSVIPYTINKEFSSSLYISVHAGEVVVNAPWYFSRKQIQAVIEEKRQWILEKIKQYQEQNNIYINKGTISILGATRPVHLYYKCVKSPTINLVDGVIEVILPNKYKKLETTSIFEVLVQKLYDKIAEQEIEKVMEKTRLMLGFAPEDYCLQRLQNNQMGLCSTADKKIIINPDIIKYDRKVIEYVVLHEFCHLKYKIHAKGFWQMIKTYMPEYETYERML